MAVKMSSTRMGPSTVTFVMPAGPVSAQRPFLPDGRRSTQSWEGRIHGPVRHAPAAQVVGAHEDAGVPGAGGPENQGRIGELPDADHDVEPVAHGIDLTGPHRDLDLDLGVLAHELGHDRRHEPRAEIGRRGDAEQSSRDGALVAHAVARLFDGRETLRCRLEESASGIGQAELARPSQDELGAEVLLELACVAVYLIPRTAVLGAILLAGYLGGAVCAHVRIGDPGAVTPLLLGIFAWGGLYLREPRLRALLPLKSPAASWS